jgi:hypothetical protein
MAAHAKPERVRLALKLGRKAASDPTPNPPSPAVSQSSACSGLSCRRLAKSGTCARMYAYLHHRTQTTTEGLDHDAD